MSIDTKQVANRRQVNYQSLADVLADAERLSSGRVRTLGNWSAGQIFQHLANAMNGSIDGLPGTFPWYVRIIARLFKKKLINNPMPAGLKVPSDLAEKVMPEPTSTELGLANLRTAITRLEREPKRAPSPIFGPLTKEEYNQLHLNHAKLHLSFLEPG
jgi:hypothetical protein